MPEFGAENKSALFQHFLLLSAVLRVRRRKQTPPPPRKPLYAALRNKVRLIHFPSFVFFLGGGVGGFAVSRFQRGLICGGGGVGAWGSGAYLGGGGGQYILGGSKFRARNPRSDT